MGGWAGLFFFLSVLSTFLLFVSLDVAYLDTDSERKKRNRIEEEE